MDYSLNFIAISYRPNNHEVDSTEPFRAGTSMTQYPSSVPLSQQSHDLDFSPRKKLHSWVTVIDQQGAEPWLRAYVVSER